MGFIAGCLLLGLLAKVSWDFVTKPTERSKMLASYAAKPLVSTFMVIWLTFFLMFFVGIFVPVFGEANITEDGWQVWEVGILGFFGLWVITWFLDLDKLDK